MTNLHSSSGPSVIQVSDLVGKPWVVDQGTGEIVDQLLSELDCREVITSIREDITAARRKLYYLYVNEAWTILGYSSWHELLSNEFSGHHSYLRRMTQAALIEASVGVEVGTHKESHLRPIYEVLKDEQLQQQAYHAAIDVEAETAQDYRKVAWVVYVNEYGNERLKARLKDGTLSPYQAYHLTSTLEDVETELIRDTVSRCSDHKLAQMIIELGKRGGDTFEEIVVSRTIPAYEEPIPLEEATAVNLKAWLDVSSAEHRAQAVEVNRGRYDRTEAALAEFIKAVQSLLAMLDNRELFSEDVLFDCQKKLENYLNARKQAGQTN